MTNNNAEYNPLDYANLTKSCVEELMKRGPYGLPLKERFAGSGVYALFYAGDFPPYAPVQSPDARNPIYVGKAVPKGARKGGGAATAIGNPLHARLGNHATSIDSAKNLRLEDFTCRYLVVTPLWITMAERFLIEHYKPIWNVILDGFGNHDPGSGRHKGVITWWDALHPGRPWAAKLQQSRSAKDAELRLSEYYQGKREAEIPPEGEEPE